MTHTTAANAKPMIQQGAPPNGGVRINVKFARLTCMSIATSRLPVRS
jgi:hypothetical protein